MILDAANRILVSFFILFFGLLMSSVAEKFSRFALTELKVNSLVKNILNINIVKTISSSIYYAGFILTIYFSLDNLGITWYLIIFWLAFILIVFAISLILDIKDGIINLYYGLKIRNIRKGITIETGIIKGKIVKKTPLGVTVNYNKELHYIPNLFLYQGYIIR